MKAYCGKCEKKVDPDAKRCPYCHEDLTKNKVVEKEPGDSVKGAIKTVHYAWAAVGFAFPIEGLIAFFIIRDDGSPAEKPLLYGSLSYLGLFLLVFLVGLIAGFGPIDFVSGDSLLRVIYSWFI